MKAFSEWLVETKCLTERSSRDVVSRLKRVLALINKSEITEDTLNMLEKNSEFQLLTMSVKSQLRRSVRLYSEYNRIKF